MDLTAPPATGVRLPWAGLPATVRSAVEEMLGAPVTGAVTQHGGFSPGVAARLTLADGRRAFVKAVSADTNADSPRMHRREAANTAALPPGTPAPRLLGTYDDGTWVVLAFEDIEGRQPRVPWRADELDRVLEAIGALSERLTPCPAGARPVAAAMAKMFGGWQRLIDAGAADGPAAGRLDPWALRHLRALAEIASGWPEPASGDTLAHCDLRADNMLLTRDRVVFVDWPHARSAAPWFDLVMLLPSVAAQGGPDPEELFTTHPSAAGADRAGVTAVLAAAAGYFVEGALGPPVPGIPTLRAFQHAQGAAALRWLRRRLGPALP